MRVLDVKSCFSMLEPQIGTRDTVAGGMSNTKFMQMRPHSIFFLEAMQGYVQKFYTKNLSKSFSILSLFWRRR